MENKNPLSLDEMEQVTGGSAKTVHAHGKGAPVYSGPGKNYHQVRTLGGGTVVNFTGTVSYNDQENKTYYLINSPTYGWMTGADLGI